MSDCCDQAAHYHRLGLSVRDFNVDPPLANSRFKHTRVDAIRATRGLEEHLHSFLTSVSDRGNLSARGTSRTTPRERVLGTY